MLLPGDRLVADANTGWTQHEAMRVVRGVQDVDVYIEQPCLTYEECLAVRRNTSHPFCSTRTSTTLDMLLRGKSDLAMDVVNLKISKLGGLTKTKQARDLCVSMGIAMTLETAGGATSRRRPSRTWRTARPRSTASTSTDFNSYVTVSTATGLRSARTASCGPRRLRDWESLRAPRSSAHASSKSAEDTAVAEL